MATRLRIGEIMDEKGIGVKELSFRADIAYSTAFRLYQGGTQRFDIPLLDKVASVLGVRFKDLFTEEDDSANSEPLRLAA
jgi:DNA-binding Xre family transcriptional regulator